MAGEIHIQGGSIPCMTSSSVSAVTLDSNGNYSSGGLRFGTLVKYDTSGKSRDVIAASTNDQVAGVAGDDPSVGPSSSIRVITDGVAKCLAGAAVSLGDLVSCDSTARVVTAAAAAATSKYLVGVALEPATAAGDLISVKLGIFGSTNVNA